jgi:hypothetical protein
MGDKKNAPEIFSEKLERYTKTLQTGDLSIEEMNSRDIMKNELVMMYASKNSNAEKLQRALEEVSKLPDTLFDKKSKELLMAIKTCAFEIAEHLDPVHVDSFQMIEKIFYEVWSRSKEWQEIQETISKNLAWLAGQEERDLENFVRTHSK